MNRIFGITGFLAVGMIVFWVVAGVSFALAFSSPPDPAVSAWSRLPYWAIMAAVLAIALGAVIGFVRSSLAAHWAALRRNAPLPLTAWRGVAGVYLCVLLMFAIPTFQMTSAQADSHRNEKVLYIGLSALCLVLTSVACRRGLRRPV